MGWLLWVGRSGLVAMGWLLGVGRYGGFNSSRPVAMGQSLRRMVLSLKALWDVC